MNYPTPRWRVRKIAPDGDIVVVDPRGLARYAQHLIGHETELVLRKRKRQRSYEQLRYWFGVPMKLLSEHTGYTKMQMHYLCLALCYGVVVDPTTGREIPVVPMSRGLTTGQFAEIISWCPPWAAETYQDSKGNPLQIPMPNEVDLDALPGEWETEIEA